MSILHSSASSILLALSLSLSLSLSVAAHAQNQPTDVTIEAHIYEPQRLPPTDERIASLQLPPGFYLQRAAEGLDNPRILATAEDGTVYVTQRQPGNLVMLRDVDRDGIFDVQRIVAHNCMAC